MNSVWREHFEALGRSNELAIRRLQDRHTDLAGALQWLSEAWDFSQSRWNSQERDADEHLEYLVRLRAALARVRFHP